MQQGPDLDLTQLSPGLEAACRGFREVHRARLVAKLSAEPGSGLVVAEEHARALEGLLGALFAAARAAMGSALLGRVALVAVGGLGRRELGLFSDLDVMLLADAPRERAVAGLAQGLLYPLWNVGLDVGHSVRAVDEVCALAQRDVRTATMLLDARRIAGDAQIVDELLVAIPAALAPWVPRTLEVLEREREERHERFGGSPFLLEPDVKSGCGALRDLDVIHWALGLRWGSAPGGARTLESAVAEGALVLHEAEELRAAHAFVWDVRQRLHVRAGRRQDRLTFEDQEEIALALGERDEPGGLLGVERFMQAYYRHARVVEHACDRMLARARAPREPHTVTREDAGEGLELVDGQLALRDPERVARDPALALRFYRRVEERAVPPDPAARDAITRAMAAPGVAEALRSSETARAAFLEMIAWTGEVPVRRGSILGELHDVGLLLAMIPEFEPVTGRVQHDVYHVYTVDVHSIAAVDRLRALMRGELADELPVATRVATEVTDRRRLALAVLLHDVGKGRGKDHSEHGAELAVPICARLGLAPDDVEHVRWLVLEHLHLYRWATRRDTSDPDTLAEIARAIGTPDRLRDLYLLTLVDLATTNPNALSTWKTHLFDDLYLDVARILEGDASEPAGAALAAELARRDERSAVELLRSMPARYAASATAESVIEHAQIASARGERVVHVALRPGSVPELAEIVVVADDRPGLLADIAAVLAANRLAITTASIHTRVRADGRAEALDVFGVRSAAGAEGPPVEPVRLGRLRTELERVLHGEISGESLLARQPTAPAWSRRRSPEVRTEVVVDNAASPHFTVVDVFTRDRIGLLHAIAHALHEEGLSIALAKVSTEGERVADAFYVTDESGARIEDAARASHLREALRRAIAELASPGAAARGD